MTRGGFRKGAGGVSTWKSGKTKTIRVPEALADEILVIARAMDSGEKFISQSKEKSISRSKAVSDVVTESKTLDLTGISIRQNNGIISVHLEDLVKAGYTLKPQKLAVMVEARIRKILNKQGF